MASKAKPEKTASAVPAEDLAAFATLVKGNAEREEVVASAVDLLRRALSCRRGGLLFPDPFSGLLRLEAPAFEAWAGQIASLPALDPAADSDALVGLQAGQPSLMPCVRGKGWTTTLMQTFGIHELLRLSFEHDGRMVALFLGEPIGAEQNGLESTDSDLLSILSALLGLYAQERWLERLLAQESLLVKVHYALSREAVDNRPLSQIIARVARESGAIAILEDRTLRMLAASEPGVHCGESSVPLAIPDGVRQSPSFKAFLQKIIRTGVPSLLPASSKGLPRDRLMIAVIGASRHLGFLSLVGAGRPLQDSDRAVLTIAAGAVALKMLYEKIALDVEENIKQDFLCNVVTNNYTSETAIIEKANYLGYNINLPFSVIVFMWVNPKTGHAEVIPAPLIGYVKQKVREWSPRSIVSSFRNVQLFALADAEGDIGPELLARKIVEVVSDQISAPYYAGVGKMVKRPQDIRHSFDQAKETVGIMQQINHRNSIENFDSLGSYSVLLGVKSITELENFALDALGDVIKHDSVRNSDLLHTLTVYITERGSHEDIAGKLHIHVNTLKYRLQKIHDLLGVSLDDPEERFSVHLAIKALRVSQACRNWGS